MCRIIPCIIPNTNKFLLFWHNPYFCNPKNGIVLFICTSANLQICTFTSGNSSFGRARPCQGRGGRFEPGFPLKKVPTLSGFFFTIKHSGGGTGRHAGLKILFAVMRVTVQFRSRVQIESDNLLSLFYFSTMFFTYILTRPRL